MHSQHKCESTECNLQVHELASKINTKQMSVKNNAKLRTVVEICIVTVNFFVISEYQQNKHSSRI